MLQSHYIAFYYTNIDTIDLTDIELLDTFVSSIINHLKTPAMKAQPYLEHNNITVNDMDEAIKFLQVAMPEFEIRGSGKDNDRRWAHIGTDHSYLALTESFDKKKGSESYLVHGFNHMGFVVDDVRSVGARLQAAGYKQSYPFTEHQHRLRDYYLDADGNEFEFIQYLSENSSERNSYED
ncbi:MAG: hypothetical protein ACI9FU_001705 [Granulosicoccus sp.]